MITPELLAETIKQCSEYKRRHPGVVYGEDFPLVAKLLLDSPEFLHILCTTAAEHSYWCMQLGASKGKITPLDLLEGELFKWMSRCVYLGVQLERRGKVNGEVDVALGEIEKQFNEEGEE